MSSLQRALGLTGAIWMGLGSIVGTGVFVSLGIAAGIVGPGVIPAVALAALLATANGLSSAQLAAAHPVSGGTYEYGYRVIHPGVGFTAGWMFLAAKSASAATAALGFAGYLLNALTLDNLARVPLALLLVIVLTLLVSRGIRRSNHANMVMVSFTLATLTFFVVMGWLSVRSESLHTHLGLTAIQFGIGTPYDFFQATALMFVAYTGYGRIATLGEEVRDPARTIPRAIIATLILTAILYVSVAATAVAVVGADRFAAVTRSAAAPLEYVARHFDTPWVTHVVALGAITAMAGVLLNLLLGLSRVALAMARRHDMPHALQHIDPHTHSPHRAVWLVGAIIACLVLIGDVHTTWSFSAFTVLIYYSITNLAALRLPPETRRFPRWISAAGLIGCLSLAFFVPLTIWLSGLTLLAIGLIWHLIVQRNTST